MDEIQLIIIDEISTTQILITEDVAPVEINISDVAYIPTFLHENITIDGGTIY